MSIPRRLWPSTLMQLLAPLEGWYFERLDWLARLLRCTIFFLSSCAVLCYVVYADHEIPHSLASLFCLSVVHSVSNLVTGLVVGGAGMGETPYQLAVAVRSAKRAVELAEESASADGHGGGRRRGLIFVQELDTMREVRALLHVYTLNRWFCSAQTTLRFLPSPATSPFLSFLTPCPAPAFQPNLPVLLTDPHRHRERRRSSLVRPAPGPDRPRTGPALGLGRWLRFQRRCSSTSTRTRTCTSQRHSRP